MFTEFWYSTDMEYWNLISIDYDGTSCPATGEILPAGECGDGWSCTWDVSDHSEDVYYIKAVMWHIYGDEMYCIGDDIISVYVEPTPPEPTFTTISNDDILEGDVVLAISTLDENIDYVLYSWRIADVYWERDITVKIQDNFFEAITIGSSVIFIVGLIDDIKHIKPYSKLLGQIIAACIAILFGVTFQFMPYHFLNILFKLSRDNL